MDSDTHNGQKRYDLILMDCNMPVMDGFEASKVIKYKAMNGELSYTPFICAATAYTLESFRVKAMSSGMDRYLTKPITIMDIE